MASYTALQIWSARGALIDAPPFYRPLVEMTPEKSQPKRLTMVLYQTGKTENGTERFENRPKGANMT